VFWEGRQPDMCTDTCAGTHPRTEKPSDRSRSASTLECSTRMGACAVGQSATMSVCHLQRVPSADAVRRPPRDFQLHQGVWRFVGQQRVEHA
jgi:hypothetical protein